MRRTGTIILLLLIPFFLFSAQTLGVTDTSLRALGYSAFSSASYYGSFSDIFVNPASLPLLERTTFYQVSYSLGENYNTSLWGKEDVSYMQNTASELQGTVVSGPVALSAKISSSLAGREVREDGGAYYDIYSSFDIELALAYSFFNHFSIGARLGGGNSVARLRKRMTGFISAMGNAWFSPYEQMTGSERFNLNVGTLVYFSNFTFGLVMDDLISSGDEGYFRHLVANTTFSFAYRGNVYNSDGDLRYLVPRIAVDAKGIGFTGERSISVTGDLTLQFLKDVLLDAGLRYSYMVSSSDDVSSSVTFSLLGNYGDFSLLLNIVFLQNTANNFRPSLIFTYSV